MKFQRIYHLLRMYVKRGFSDYCTAKAAEYIAPDPLCGFTDGLLIRCITSIGTRSSICRVKASFGAFHINPSIPIASIASSSLAKDKLKNRLGNESFARRNAKARNHGMVVEAASK